ncbi:MAG TPA: SH3 domain-containing protein, partial [Pyrinomonadaceae bacterium]|nr:SH3 domain-containing protein [Pyrinomonadaceae bacterium]
EVIVGGEVKYPAWQPDARRGITIGGDEESEVEMPGDVEANPDGIPHSAFRVPHSAPRPRFARRLATFAILLLIFAGGLYGTSAYLRSRGILPGISNPFTAKTGRANTDINLRPEPNANNDPIGMVTKDSRVRVIKTQNNWYQVDVIEQGRQRDGQLATNRGWLNGKYVDLD